MTGEINIPDKPGYIILDIETLGFTPLYYDKVTCVCAKDSDGKTFAKITKSNDDEGYLIQNFLNWLSKRPHEKYFLVTANGKQFDIPFLFIRYALRFGYDPLNDLPMILYEHLDLQEVTSKKVSLQCMAELLGCTPKSGTGSNAIKLWKEGRYKELKNYCQQDVLTTEEVFLKWKALHNPVKRTHKTESPPGGIITENEKPKPIHSKAGQAP